MTSIFLLKKKICDAEIKASALSYRGSVKVSDGAVLDFWGVKNPNKDITFFRNEEHLQTCNWPQSSPHEVHPSQVSVLLKSSLFSWPESLLQLSFSQSQDFPLKPCASFISWIISIHNKLRSVHLWGGGQSERI